MDITHSHVHNVYIYIYIHIYIYIYIYIHLFVTAVVQQIIGFCKHSRSVGIGFPLFAPQGVCGGMEACRRSGTGRGGRQINPESLVFASFSEWSRWLRFFWIWDPEVSIFYDCGCHLDLHFSSTFEKHWNFVFWNKYKVKTLFLQIRAPRFCT